MDDRASASYANNDAIRSFLPRSGRILLWTIAVPVAVLVLAPCVYLVVWGFWGTEVIGLLRPPSTPTLHWFQQIVSSSEWRLSIGYSLLVAVGVAIAGTVVLLVHSYLARYGSRLLDTMSFASIVCVLLTPPITYGMALRLTGSWIGCPEWFLLALGHLVLTLPLQFMVFEASRERVDSEMLYAGSTMGASHFTNLVQVYFPNMLAPSFYSFVVGFFVSFDEVVVALFVIQSSAVTVPRRLWDNVSHLATPDPAVIAVLLLALFVLAFAAGEVLRRRLSHKR